MLLGQMTAQVYNNNTYLLLMCALMKAGIFSQYTKLRPDGPNSQIIQY